MKKFLLLLPLLLTGCITDNVSTTKFTYTDPSGASVSIEMPKEMTATNLQVSIDPSGLSTIKADSIKTTNLEAIRAQGEAFKQAAAAATKAGVEAAATALLPRP